jgi:hypothetical protein
MPTATYDLLSSTVLGSATSTVTFSSISGSYRDLVIVFTGGVTARTGQFLEFNGDTTNANYANVYAYGSGAGGGASTFSAAAADRQIAEVIENSAANNAIIQILDYSATNKHKTSLIRVNNSTVNGTEMRVHRWANTAAITSVSLVASGTTWLSGSTFYLYGIVS